MRITLFGVQAAASLFLIGLVSGWQWPMTAMVWLLVLLLPVALLEAAARLSGAAHTLFGARDDCP